MSTFDIKEYIAQVAENVLSQQTDYDFQLTEVSGLAGLEGIISGQVAFDNFIATDSTGDGYVYQQPNGGYFMRRVATVFIMRKYTYMDMAAMREEVEKCRRYFNLIAAQMVADQPDLETKLIYLNTERIVIREFEPETSAHFTGLYFMLEFSQPYSLVAAPPVPPTPEPAYIKGHIVDGARTFTFRFNARNVTVDVDTEGFWKLETDERITNLEDAFYVKQNLDFLEINVDLSFCNNFYRAFYNCIYLNNLIFKNKTPNTIASRVNNFVHFDAMRTIDLSMFTFEQLRSTWSMFNSTLLEEINLQNADFRNLTETTNMFANCKYLKSIQLKQNSIRLSISLADCRILQKSAIITFIKAAAANVTYTLYSTVYQLCATGGEWHADVQAAIDAKAAEGFTVTLISA